MAVLPVTHLPIAILPDVGGGEMLMIMFVALLLFGGEKLPQFAKGFGKALREFKRAANEVEQEIKRAIDEVPDAPDIKSTLLRATEDKPKAVAQPASVAAAAVPPAPVASAAPAPEVPPSATTTAVPPT